MKSRKLCHECPCSDCRTRREARSLERPAPWVPAEGEFTLVAGITRMGKSTWLKELAKHLVEEGVCVIAWDPAREFSRHGIERARTPLGPLTTQVTVTELEDQPERLLEIEALAPAVAIVPDEERPTRAQVAQGFVRAMNVVRQRAPDMDVVLLLEELGLLEGDGAAEDMVDEITTTYGKEGFSGFLATQCTGMVPDRSRRNCRKVVSFRQIDDNDLTALTRLVGRKFRLLVEQLGPHECVLADRMERHLWRGEDALEETSAENAA